MNNCCKQFAEEVLEVVNEQAEDEAIKCYTVIISKELYDMLVRKAANPQDSKQ